MKLANYFNRQLTDHISTHEWDSNGPNDWCWTLEPLSLNSAGIVRMPMTDPMCHRNPKLLLSLNEIMEWGALATTRGQCLIERRLMGHTMVPLCQAVGSTAVPPGTRSMRMRTMRPPMLGMLLPKRKARMMAMWRLLSPRLPMLSSRARRLSCGRMPRALSSDRTEPGD